MKKILFVLLISFVLFLNSSCDNEEGCPPGTETIRDSNGDIVDCLDLLDI